MLIFILPFFLYNFQARRYREKERICRAETCQLVNSSDYSTFTLDQLKCIRLCVSKPCYNEIYAWNEV